MKLTTRKYMPCRQTLRHTHFCKKHWKAMVCPACTPCFDHFTSTKWTRPTLRWNWWQMKRIQKSTSCMQPAGIQRQALCAENIAIMCTQKFEWDRFNASRRHPLHRCAAWSYACLLTIKEMRLTPQQMGLYVWPRTVFQKEHRLGGCRWWWWYL